jgi:glycosyltransferase involved in cell wall biosynthesis
MKILHVFVQPRSGGGSLASTLATIELTRARGHEVEAFTIRSGDYPDTLATRLRAARSAFSAPGSVRAFRDHLLRFGPDLVHANELFPYITPDVLAVSKQHGVPVIMTCDDYHLTCPVRNHFRGQRVCTKCLGGREYWSILHNCRKNLPESLVNAAYNAVVRRRRWITKHVDHFITCSEFTRQWLMEHAGIDAERITAIPHAIDIPPTAADAGVGQYAAFSGRFVPEKGIDVFLAAAALCRVPAKLSRNVHHFVTIDLPPSVDVVVTARRDELDRYYRNARMLVFPSRWFETYGVVGAEAMSHGIPVIAARIGALSQLVDDGVDGLLFEPGDFADLARKMQRLWDDPELCRRMGAAARAKAVARWSHDRNYDQTYEVYRRVVAIGEGAR